MLSTIERAANRGNAQQLKQLYGARFERSGGLERSQLVAGLSQLHQRYEQLQYDIQLQSWQRRGRGFVTTTETHVTGKRQGEHRTFQLDARLRSRQRLADRTVTRQTILSERTELTAGSNPPQVRINLPATVAPGERFHFDAIATQPLGDAVLLGSATMQAVSGQRYLQPPPGAATAAGRRPLQGGPGAQTDRQPLAVGRFGPPGRHDGHYAAPARCLTEPVVRMQYRRDTVWNARRMPAVQQGERNREARRQPWLNRLTPMRLRR